MKFKSFFLFTLLFTLIISNFNCKDNTDPDPTPKAELILGTWNTTQMQRDGVNQPIEKPDGVHAIFIFNADSTVTYSRYDSNGDAELQFDDVWTLSSNEDIIMFEGESDVDLIEITETTLVVEYTSIDPFTSNQVQHNDTFEKE